MPPPAGQHAPGAADTEASLIARAQAGDVGAFERLSGAYADRLFMLLLRLLGDRSEAEDVAQEVMLRAWQGITRFRGQSSYFTWLYRIAVNEANRALERRVPPPAGRADRRARTPAARVPGARASPPGRSQRTAPAARPGPGRAAGGAADRHRAARCRRALHPEAAEIADVSLAAFKSRRHQARLRVRAAIGDEALAVG